jgi:uncharacterized Zn finger protein
MIWFTDEDLRRLAGTKSYERGIGYVSAVSDLDELPDGVTATVLGTEPYHVRLRDRDESLTGDCTCPHSQDGAFCKHCVAVGLTLLGDARTDRPKQQRARKRTSVDLRSYLSSVNPTDLVDLLLELAADDPALHRRLSLRAATNGTPDVKELRRLVGGLRARGYLDYSRSFGYAAKANDVLDALDAVATSHPKEIGPLYPLVIQHLTRTTEQADDSSGVIGDAIDRGVDGYAGVCRAAPPDPTELATWMIDFQVEGPGWPEIPVADFADALGPTGLAAYWRRLDDLSRSPGSDEFTIRHLREEYLKTISGDTDALVAHYAEDLPQAYRYVQIGETLRDAGRIDEAIDWLRRGHIDADHPDSRIDLLLAELLTATGQHTEAVDTYWKLFTSRPDVDSHRRLLDAAERAGTLAETADRATAQLHERATRGGYQADPLVTILLAADNVDAAWAAASEYRCSPGLLFTVAGRRADTHPADAIPAYAARVEDLIDRKNRTAYADAVKLLNILRVLHHRAGTDFTSYLEALKETHHRKTTFLAELAHSTQSPRQSDRIS